MKVTEELKALVTSYETDCPMPGCQSEGRAISDLLLSALSSELVTGLVRIDPGPESTPYGVWELPTYEVIHKDGRKLRLTFRGISNIEVRSSRGRYSHYQAEEFDKKLQRFLSPTSR